VVVSPTHPTPAPKLGQAFVDWEGNPEPVNTTYSRLTGPANICGLPAVSVPCGISGEGLPIGFQVMGPPLEEARVLRVAEVIERAHTLTAPPLQLEVGSS